MTTYLHLPNQSSDYNAASCKTLMRAINISQGDFSLILAHCNCSQLREEILQQIIEQCPLAIQELALDCSTRTLYSTITEALCGEQPNALMVSQLESVNDLDQLLIATNHAREEFRKLAFPMVLWVTDDVWQKLIRLVPDFENWATSVEFTQAVDEHSSDTELELVA